jgi:hypothetical protein
MYANHFRFTGNPPYSNLPYLPDGTGIRPVRVGSKRRSLTRLLGTGMVSSRAHMGRRVRCWSVVAPFDRGEHIQQRLGDRAMIQVAAQLLITPTLEHLVDGLGLRMQHGNRAGHAQRPLLSTGRTGFTAVSSNASLNHPVNHRHITAGKCISVETVRSDCRQHAGRRQSEASLKLTQIPRSATVFVTRASWPPTQRRRIRDSSDENGAIFHG